VIVKAHPGHPELSARTAEVMIEALMAAGAPDGTFGLIAGFDVGVTALKDARITAAGFTGSVPAGKALHEIAVTRPEPIPFYGELGSLNPVFVTQAANRCPRQGHRDRYVGSFTLGVGQFLHQSRDCSSCRPAMACRSSSSRQPAESPRRRCSTTGSRTASAPVSTGWRRSTAFRVWSSGPATLLQTTVGELLAQRDEILEECFRPGLHRRRILLARRAACRSRGLRRQPDRNPARRGCGRPTWRGSCCRC